MSQFSNRRDIAGSAPGAADPQQAYIQALLGLLDGREPVPILTETPSWLRDRSSRLSAEHLNAPESPGKWSIAGVIAHLADSEIVWGFRLRMVLAEERPTLAGYDQDRWADALRYDDPDLASALAVFDALRHSHLALLAGLQRSEWQRTAWHDERGEETVRHMVGLYAGHDLVHRRQIERIEGQHAK